LTMPATQASAAAPIHTHAASLSATGYITSDA